MKRACAHVARQLFLRLEDEARHIGQRELDRDRQPCRAGADDDNRITLCQTPLHRVSKGCGKIGREGDAINPRGLQRTRAVLRYIGGLTPFFSTVTLLAVRVPSGALAAMRKTALPGRKSFSVPGPGPTTGVFGSTITCAVPFL